MTTTQIVLAVLALILAAFLFAAWKALRCTAGWRVWFLATIARVYMGIMLKWTSNKPCPFPRDGAAIIVGNHTSPVDPILLWYRHNAEWPANELRAIGFMVAAEYVSRKDIVGWVCRSMESIPVKRAGRDMAAVRQTLARLAENKWLGIFPEGHINLEPENGLKEFNTGAAFISLKSGVPIYPVYIHDSPRSTSMAKCFFKRSHVRITYGEPIDLTAEFGEVKLNAQTLQAATNRVRNELADLSENRWWQAEPQSSRA